MDEDGYLAIVDRKKDMTCAAEYNVYPRELEEVIMTHPQFLLSPFGGPDDKMGEEVKAYLSLKKVLSCRMPTL